MKIHQLINNDSDCCETIFVKSKESETCLDGILLKCTSWSLDNKPSSCDFIVSVYIKWDGCSHFRFYGDDYLNDSEQQIDPYYHICGFDSYITHFRSIIFALKLARHYITDMCEYELSDYNNFESQINLLDGYSIKELEIDEDNEIYYYIKELLKGN